MCNREECDGQNTDHDWCPECGEHQQEVSRALHNARNHAPNQPGRNPLL